MKTRLLARVLFASLIYLLTLSLPARGPAFAPEAVVHVTRAGGRISIDGNLDDPGWCSAAKVTRFYEASPGNNVTPPVRTTAWITYDSKYLYVAFRCEDPNPTKIRAPYVARDAVGADQDFVAVGLDTRGDRQSALLFFVNPRGIQTDGIRNDATGTEDFSPDFFWDSAARITTSGWDAEMRIPFSSLRYTQQSLSNWGILFYRNYPRAYRFQLFSSRVPRGSDCEVCHAMQIDGLQGIRKGHHLILAPHVSGQKQWTPARGTGSHLASGPAVFQKGVDVKWSPGARAVVDLTVDPDFSQVEADTVQIAANKRFALFYPEKRPFFMEAVDLLDTPIDAAYTRTITAPLWGARITGRLAGADYTFLTARDAGGGSVIIPGPQDSGYAPQDFSSQASVLRVRKTVGGSFAGFLVTDRESDGGSYNRVFGPDVQWHPDPANRISGQFLFSMTRTPNRPDLNTSWDGASFSGGDLALSWSHDTRTWNWLTQYADVSPKFRADDGFVPRVGYRELSQQTGYSTYPNGFFRKLTPTLVARWYWNRAGRSLEGSVWPGVEMEGRDNLQADLFVKADTVRAGTALLHATRIYLDASLSPSQAVPQVSWALTLGEDFDFVNGTVGRGGDATAGATFRPGDHIGLRIDAEHQWLNSSNAAHAGRLFTADAFRVEGLYTFSARSFLRAIAQYIETRRDPALYPYPVSRRDGGLQTSLLYSYQINWQTALYLGYADQRELAPSQRFLTVGRQVFFKISYAFQR